MEMTSTLTSEVNDVKIYRLNQHVAAFITSLGGFALGVTLGWNSNAGEILRNILNASGTEIGLIGSILNAGACVGVTFTPFFIKYFSRITAMSLTMPGFIVGWTFVCCAGHKISLLIIGRFICGMSGGAFSFLTPIYIAEIADQNSRERLLMYFHLLINCGIMYAFVIAHVINEHDTIWRYNIICAVTCLVIALVNLLPESPFYYLMKNNEMKAKDSLKWYRGQTYEDDVEIEELKYLVKHSGKITRNVLKNRYVASSFFTCIFVFLTQQLSGVNIMIFYALTLFNVGGSGDLTGSEQTVLIGGVQILSCFLAISLIDIVGRRILLIVSSIFMGLFLILLGWFYELRNQDPEYDDIYFWMPPTWTILFFATFNAGVGPISWALLGDVFPMQIRETAVACTAGFNWMLSLIATMTFGEMLGILGISKTMWLFASFCWVAGILCALLLKDTHGYSLAKIQKNFGIENEQMEMNSIERT
ncbi:PREDICTED: facilitated trehalose transporter Tret1-like isoform X2 [Wasmannia auropunctata]|uniref:facilitated trehalose transporter Tret1-like isoform X2 n=1 Tax=Wasmannia auropunctata TaxID=64793 RepID=UPI0005EDF2E8|nr:PREDICTED: facilitated trehalose transporter Tret1-like isoform X2 [Wasmannia auropunctata]